MEINASPVITGLSTRKKRLLRNHDSLTATLQLIVDQALVLASLFILLMLRSGEVQTAYQVLAVVTLLSMWFIYGAQGVYRRANGYLKGCLRISVAWLSVILFLAVLGFLTKTSAVFSRQVLVSWAILAWLLQLCAFCSISYFAKQYRERFSRNLPTLVVGTGAVACHLVKSLNQNRWLPDQVVGCVAGDEEEVDEKPSVSLLGRLENIRNLIEKHKIRRIYIALPMSESEQIEGLNIDLLDMNVDVIWVPDIFALNLLNHSVREVAGVPLISLNESPLSVSKSASLLKDLLDKSLATITLLLISPLMVWVAWKVKKSSPGPIIFRQKRHGWDGRIIEVWKFRSMKLHREAETSVTQATREDPRVTDIGRFIRRTSIDELPQLFNVLQGTMSLVGPRPHAVAHNDYYSDKINAYLARHRIKPGITGLAQVSGYRGETETLDKMQKRVEYDLAYINNWSVGLDIKILIKTPLSLFSKEIY
ncbi:undecaprenyl-phosphate glucose phosphotransferase [Marinobacterium jannaschii]|uniref:undecaprenyl-phosphate glucose phosphotransferase n=1 Tax=Marinobacterium jannaschii TaxID=64970 RepID=UPI0006852737|nr:undecaprenyl-phosphate glucose phosphotransferase [Marinobacterium jannaschii]